MSSETRLIGSLGRDNRGSDHPIYGQTPKQIDAYDVVRLVGQGSMGSVYEVQHQTLGRHFALKLMAGTLAGNQEAIERFRSETKALGRLDHPNIVQAVDAGQWQGRLYLVTELLSGADLASQVARVGRLPIAQVIPIAAQLCNALSSAHAHGFYHRDIKPSNVFLLQNGTVKLLDFGLVRCESAASMTRAGSFMGTVDFVAPEQAGNPTTARACSDIYSLGCSLIFLLSAQPPFDDQSYPSIAAKINAHLHDMPKWFDQEHAGEDRWFVELLRSMVAKNPNDRPESCQAIADCVLQNGNCESNLTARKSISINKPGRSVLSKSAWTLAGFAATTTVFGLWWQRDKQPSQLEQRQTQVAGPQSTSIESEQTKAKSSQVASTTSPTEIGSATPNNSQSTATLPVSRTQSARGVPQFTKQQGDKHKADKQPPSVPSNKYD
ncbi:MAG: serine/threonine-protein kinase [Pirellulales bacterium]